MAWKIRTPEDKERFEAFLSGMPMPYTLTAEAGIKESRSKAQNRLQRVWCGLISGMLDNGYTPENVRGISKLHCGVAIMKAASDEYAEKYDRLIRPLSYEDKLELMQEPLDFPVTRAMTVKQKDQYLHDMQAFWAERGVTVSFPGDWV